MSLISAFYLILLSAVAGYVLVARIPSLLHTPMMSGSNFIHGIVLAGAMLALAGANNTIEFIIGFVAVMAASANVFGGFIVTDRMLKLFDEKGIRNSVTMLASTAQSQANNTLSESAESTELSGDKIDTAVSNNTNTSKSER